MEDRKGRSRKCFGVLEKVIRLSKKKEKVEDRKSRSIICFDVLEKVTQLRKKKKKTEDRKSRLRKCFDVLENVTKLCKKKLMWSCGNGYQSSMFYRVHSGSEYTELYNFLRQFVFSCRQVGDVYVPHSSASITVEITV